MSKERARSRDGQTGTAAKSPVTKPEAGGPVHEPQERVLSLKGGDETSGPGAAITQSPRRSGSKHVPKNVKSTGKPQTKSQIKSQGTTEKKTPDKSAKPVTGAPASGPKAAARKPTKPTTGRPAKKRGRGRSGRPDGPLARRRRFRVRLLVAILLVVNIAVALVWRDWSVSLAALILSVVTAPLLAALLLRRRR